ncbi:hypothetical protein J4440_02390 [Candidatus Woesearchaeota archaeon]|nr:hypothetical protein [Candidatus Woesearchaeota archaeon]
MEKFALRTYILQRPEGLDYPLRYKQLYGFFKDGCEREIQFFEDKKFIMAYFALTHISAQNEEQLQEKSKLLVNSINLIIEKSNEEDKLDCDSLDKLLFKNFINNFD